MEKRKKKGSASEYMKEEERFPGGGRGNCKGGGAGEVFKKGLEMEARNVTLLVDLRTPREAGVKR